MSRWVSENTPVIIYPINSSESQAPPNSPRPRDRAKSHPHSCPRDPRRKNRSRSQIRRATFSKVALPETASDQYISLWNRSILDKQSVSSNPPVCFFAFFYILYAVREFKSPTGLLCIFIFFCCTAVRARTSALVMYTRGGFVGCCWWMSFPAVYCAVLLYQEQRTAVLL